MIKDTIQTMHEATPDCLSRSQLSRRPSCHPMVKAKSHMKELTSGSMNS